MGSIWVPGNPGWLPEKPKDMVFQLALEPHVLLIHHERQSHRDVESGEHLAVLERVLVEEVERRAAGDWEEGWGGPLERCEGPRSEAEACSECDVQKFAAG